MQKVRDAIKPYLDDLADDNGVLFGGFNITYTISFHKDPAHDHNTEVPRYLIYRGETAVAKTNIYEYQFRFLLLGMSKFPESYADKIGVANFVQRFSFN